MKNIGIFRQNGGLLVLAGAALTGIASLSAADKVPLDMAAGALTADGKVTLAPIRSVS